MFAEVLQRLVEETGGGIGAVLIGYDGIPVEQYFPEPEQVDLQLLAVEFANVLKEVRKMAEVLDSGTMEELAVKTGRLYMVARGLTEEYFVLLALSREGNFGKGRYLLNREASSLRQELV